MILAVSAPGCSGPLDGRTYESVKVTGRDLVPETTVALTFDGHSVSVQAGCNTSNSRYEVNGDQLTTTGDSSTTLMGCDPARSAQDMWINEWLSSGVRMAETDDSLTLEGSGVTIEFRRS